MAISPLYGCEVELKSLTTEQRSYEMHITLVTTCTQLLSAKKNRHDLALQDCVEVHKRECTAIVDFCWLTQREDAFMRCSPSRARGEKVCLSGPSV